MADNELYQRTKRSLGLAIFLIQLAIALSLLVFVNTLEISFNLLSVFGIFSLKDAYLHRLAWGILALVISSLIVSQFLFIRNAKALFASESNAIECFGTSTETTSKSLAEVRRELSRYAMIALPLAFVIVVLIGLPFANVLLAATLTFILVVLFLFYRDNAKLLGCDAELLS